MSGSLVKGDWIGVNDEGETLLVRHPHVSLFEPIKITIDYSKLEEVKVLTTDEMDKTTSEERSKLVGYCENDDEYTHFDMETDGAVCRICGGKFSNWVGFQIESERTFNYFTAKKKKKPKGK